jgi:hypothetical protein
MLAFIVQPLGVVLGQICDSIGDRLRLPVACTINIYDRRFYDRNDICLYYNTLETIVIDDPSLN